MSTKVGVDLDKITFDRDGNVIVEDVVFAKAIERGIPDIGNEEPIAKVVSPCMSGCSVTPNGGCPTVGVNYKGKCITVGSGCPGTIIKTSKMSFEEVLIKNSEFAKAIIDLKASNTNHVEMVIDTNDTE